MKVVVWFCTGLFCALTGPASSQASNEQRTPYSYRYDVNESEFGDVKGHREQRGPDGVVIGSFYLVDPFGALRTISYRVEGNSGFVITKVEIRSGYARPPPPPPPTRRPMDRGVGGSTGSSGAAGNATVTSSRRTSNVTVSSQPNRPAAVPSKPRPFAQNPPTGARRPPLQQNRRNDTKSKGGSAVKLTGPAFSFSIVRGEPNRFSVEENIVGHQVEFETHGIPS